MSKIINSQAFRLGYNRYWLLSHVVVNYKLTLNNHLALLQKIEVLHNAFPLILKKLFKLYFFLYGVEKKKKLFFFKKIYLIQGKLIGFLVNFFFYKKAMFVSVDSGGVVRNTKLSLVLLPYYYFFIFNLYVIFSKIYFLQQRLYLELDYFQLLIKFKVLQKNARYFFLSWRSLNIQLQAQSRAHNLVLRLKTQVLRVLKKDRFKFFYFFFLLAYKKLQRLKIKNKIFFVRNFLRIFCLGVRVFLTSVSSKRILPGHVHRLMLLLRIKNRFKRRFARKQFSHRFWMFLMKSSMKMVLHETLNYNVTPLTEYNAKVKKKGFFLRRTPLERSIQSKRAMLALFRRSINNFPLVKYWGVQQRRLFLHRVRCTLFSSLKQNKYSYFQQFKKTASVVVVRPYYKVYKVQSKLFHTQNLKKKIVVFNNMDFFFRQRLKKKYLRYKRTSRYLSQSKKFSTSSEMANIKKGSSRRSTQTKAKLLPRIGISKPFFPTARLSRDQSACVGLGHGLSRAPKKKLSIKSRQKKASFIGKLYYRRFSEKWEKLFFVKFKRVLTRLNRRRSRFTPRFRLDFYRFKLGGRLKKQKVLIKLKAQVARWTTKKFYSYLFFQKAIPVKQQKVKISVKSAILQKRRHTIKRFLKKRRLGFLLPYNFIEKKFVVLGLKYPRFFKFFLKTQFSLFSYKYKCLYFLFRHRWQLRSKVILQKRKKNLFFFLRFFRIIRSKKYFHLLLLFFKTQLESCLARTFNLQVYFYFKNFFNYTRITPHIFGYLHKLSKAVRPVLTLYKYSSYIELLNMVYVSLLFRLPKLFNYYIFLLFSKTLRHTKILKHLQILLENLVLFFPHLASFKIKITGKFNGNLRTRLKVLSLHNSTKFQNHQRLSCSISYNYMEAITYTGVFGLHTWFYYHN